MSSDNSPIVGIDLGTTNSVVAVYTDGRVRVIQADGDPILPSVVAMTMDNKLLVGNTAKNQLAAFPERTIASIKRKMGQAVKVKMADQEYTPQEISAIILRKLRQRAEEVLGVPVTRAVITVPAFFDEHQRQATREAGQLAGLTVERIINEPTAASLVYHAGDAGRRHLMIYDLGGGTFDVSIVRLEGGVVEVLSSRGDTQLGGDDFDLLLTKYVADKFQEQHNVDLMENAPARWRLLQACERAKCQLSTDFSVKISEEFITTVDGQPVNLDLEITRIEYEELIQPLVDRTLTCVSEALLDSGLTANHLDELVLVGGSTRTPMIQHVLRSEYHREPQWSVNPDLAVAMGAATQAAMQEGHAIGPVLIDVASHTLGIEVLKDNYSGELGFCPIIRRNSPLPAKYEELFRTSMVGQSAVEINVYQGESRELRHNQLIGTFMLEDLDESEEAEGQIAVRFDLTLDGTLKVTAMERATGKSQSLKIQNALSQMLSNDAVALQTKMDDMVQGEIVFGEPFADMDSDDPASDDRTSEQKSEVVAMRIDAGHEPDTRISQLVKQAHELRSNLGETDLQDIDQLLEKIDTAQRSGNEESLALLETELDDLLFYFAE